MEEKKYTQIGEIGEFGLIDRINKMFPVKDKRTIVGMGDDTAVLETSDKELLWSADMLNEGVHFDLSYTPLPHLGYKAVSVNVSDIAAMNGKPLQIVVSLGISSKFTVEAVEALFQGIRQACTDYDIELVGGDTTASAAGLILSVGILGEVDSEKKTLRRGATKDDIICVTGDLGAAYLGLQVLEREKQVFLSNPEMQPNLEKYQYIVERQLKPKARTDIVFELEEVGVVPTSMIDVSDGLASELLHLGKHSGVGVRVFEKNLPIDSQAYDAAVEFNLSTTTCMLNGGEDYELLFTISQEDFKKIEKHPDIHFIGYVHDKQEENILISKQDQVVPITAQGWTHFG